MNEKIYFGVRFVKWSCKHLLKCWLTAIDKIYGSLRKINHTRNIRRTVPPGTTYDACITWALIIICRDVCIVSALSLSSLLLSWPVVRSSKLFTLYIRVNARCIIVCNCAQVAASVVIHVTPTNNYVIAI